MEVGGRQDYGEQRYVIVRIVDGDVLYIAYAEQNNVIRIISARRATSHEHEA